MKPVNGNVTLALRPIGGPFVAGSSVLVEFMVRNIGRWPVVLPGHFAPPDDWLTMDIKRGDYVLERIYVLRPFVCQELALIDGAFYGFDYDLAQYYPELREPGTYTVTATLGGEGNWRSRRLRLPPIRSNTVEITVLPREGP